LTRAAGNPLRAWRRCSACGLAAVRRCVVLGRGEPGGVCFVGEAPGKAEEILGAPFVGPSGRLLADMVSEAHRLAYLESGSVPIYITNTCACRPQDAEGGNRAPTDAEAVACRPRLRAELAYARPLRVVFLGNVADKFARPEWRDGFRMLHPAYLLRKGGAASYEFLRGCRDLQGIFMACARILGVAAPRRRPTVGRG